MERYFDKVYYGNTIEAYLIAAGIILGGMLLARLFRKSILQRIKRWADKTENTLDDFVVLITEKYGMPILNYSILYAGFQYLNLSEDVIKYINIATTVVVVYFIIRIILSIIRKALESYVLKQENGEAKLKQITGIMVVINIAVWALGFVFLFDNMGYDVTAIITGLGIGGIAIALAAQNILGDLFNYFVIFFDRPFEVGDFVVVDDKRGNVEYIGIKSTRIKSITGEQIVISNSNLTNARLHNFRRMDRRRIIFSIGVVYGTPLEKLKKISKVIWDIIENEPNATPDRVHFATYGDFSLNFEIVFYAETSDYAQYMNIQQNINLRIYEEFEKMGVEFAFPTQTIFLQKANGSSA